MASGGYRPALGVEQHLTQAVASSGVGGRAKGKLEIGQDFPIVCETCLGESPYIRMIKLRFGDRLCKVTNGAFQAFRWKAGPKGRFKETIVCREVAIEKNICQACLSDMTFGVPVGVRDALLKQKDDESGGYAEPKSAANKAYYYQNQLALKQERAVVEEPSRELVDLAREIQSANSTSGTPFRNLPRLCSFWLKACCSRVGAKTCPFRPCCGVFKFPELAASQPDACKKLVELLRRDGAATVMTECPNEIRAALKDAISGVNHNEAIRDRAAGNDTLSQRYVARASSHPVAPHNGTSLIWVGGNFKADTDLVDALYHVGEIQAVKLADGCAFVDFVDPSAAAKAVRLGTIVVGGMNAPLDYARPKQQPPTHTPPAAPPQLPPHLAKALDAWEPSPPPPPPPPGQPPLKKHRP